MKKHEDWLNAYVDGKLKLAGDPSALEMKRGHTFKVLENARAVVEAEALPEPVARATLLGALYHDVARFDQYLIHGTFKDALSFNHGLQGVRILKKLGRLNNESPRVAALALAAVGLHNRREIPAKLAPEAALAVSAIRDADKVDILRVLDGHLSSGERSPAFLLSLPDDPDLRNPLVCEEAMRRRPAGYGDLRSVNDFRVLMGAWLFSLNFDSSRALFLAAPHAQRLIEALPDNASYGPARDFLLASFSAERKRLGIS